MKNSENKSLDGIKRAIKDNSTASQPDPNEQVHLDELNEDVRESLSALEDDLDDESANTPSCSPRQNSRQLDKPSNSNGHVSRKVKKKHGKRWSRKKKIIVAVVIILVVIIGAIVAYGYIALDKVSSIFSGNPLDILTPAKLKEDQYGRSNILVFGTSEDDEGHSGAQLADSIMVLSIDQDTNDVAMFSIPRDLWVDYGVACSVGYSGKINATYLCGLETNNNDQAAASQQFASTVSTILGMDIPYYIKVDYGAISGVTDALGGIDVDVYSADPRGLYDVQTGLNLPAGVNHLNGEQALLLARARNSKGGYGLPRSNFDREKNQKRIVQALQKNDREKNQKRIVQALQKKALSLGVLANPQQALSILDSLGDNIKTNITMSELRQSLDIALGAGDKGIRDIDISDQLKTGRVGSASVVMPVAGQDNFSSLQSYLREQLDNTTASTSAGDGQ